MIDFDKLWIHIVQTCSPSHAYSIHGPDHWRRVERNGLILAKQSGALVDVVRLFALFHDCKRIDDGWDPDHGKRGADHAIALRGQWFDLPNEQMDLLIEACTGHTEIIHHHDPTIGTCWDADRLDLGRAGLIPNAKFMNTALGAEIANYGTIMPWIDASSR
jgi:uncharacterized protein